MYSQSGLLYAVTETACNKRRPGSSTYKRQPTQFTARLIKVLLRNAVKNTDVALCTQNNSIMYSGKINCYTLFPIKALK